MRTFLSVNFAAAMQDRIWSAFQPLRRSDMPWRWVSADLIHLTLKFLGNVEPDRVEAVSHGVRDAVVGVRPFQLRVHGAGVFPNVRRPKVLFATCEFLPALELLQDRIERAMKDVGFPVEGRTFRPHLTVARARRDGDRYDWAKLNQAISTVRVDETSHVPSVHIMESRLHSAGPEYLVHESIPLEG